jgi:hypothetical protein
MQQMARNATGEEWGFLEERRYALHDRDRKFCSVFRDTLAAGGIKPIQLPARSPNLNAYAERWVRSVKEECLSKLILFGETSLRRALTEFIDHFHGERNHRGKGNVLLFPAGKVGRRKARTRVRCRERLGGLMKLRVWLARLRGENFSREIVHLAVMDGAAGACAFRLAALQRRIER